jgi:hypothetical protein
MDQMKRKIDGGDEFENSCINKQKRTSFRKLPKRVDGFLVMTLKPNAKINYALRRKAGHVSKANFTQHATEKFKYMFVLIYIWEEYFDSKGVKHFGPNKCEFDISYGAVHLRIFNFSFLFLNRCCTILVGFERTIAS